MPEANVTPKFRQLNFGCGTHYDADWVNVDGGDHLTKLDYRFDFQKFPYPLPDNWFEHIKAQQVMEHIDYRFQAPVLKELLRITKPGGTIVVDVPNIGLVAKEIIDGQADTPEHRDRVLLELLGGQRHPFDYHVGGLWEARLRYLLKDSGWVIEKVYCIGRKLIGRAKKE